MSDAFTPRALASVTPKKKPITVWEAADRIEALSEQLEAAHADAKEAEAYAEELTGDQVDLCRQLIAAEDRLAKAVEGLDKAAALIEDRHVVHMTSKGRDPKDYISDWSLIAKEVRALLAEIEGTNAP